MIKKKLEKSSVHMDMINHWLLQMHEAIENDVNLSTEDQEYLEAIIYGNISHFLEKFFDFPDYNSYN